MPPSISLIQHLAFDLPLDAVFFDGFLAAIVATPLLGML